MFRNIFKYGIFLVIPGIVGGFSVFLRAASGPFWLGTNLAFTLSFACSTLTHYSLNRFWALPSARQDTARQAREYLGAVVISYVMNLSVFHLCLDGFGMGKVLATAVAVPPSTVVVFLLLNYRVFRARSS